MRIDDKSPKWLRMFKERLDYVWFILRVNNAFYYGVILAVVGASFAVFKISRINDPISRADGTIAVVSLLFAIFGLYRAYKASHQFGPKDERFDYITAIQDSLKIDCENIIPFSKLTPSKDDRNHGFETVVSGYNAGECAISSSKLNTWLTSHQPDIEVSVVKSRAYKFCERDEIEKHDEQLKFLRAKVYQEKITLNHRKFALSSSFYPNIEKVSLSRVGYYDSLVTNEAFRSVIRKRRKGADGSEQISDLRKYFPIVNEDVDGEDTVCLSSENWESISGHVGITTLVITKDNFPVFVQQGKATDIGSGKFTACGSGSVDFRDIKRSKSDFLLDIIKFSMAREFSEEGQQLKSILWRSKFIRRISDETLVIGYFRWIDRCGMPEFIGITRSHKELKDIKPDGVEVYELPRETRDKVKFKIFNVSNFEKLANRIRSINGMMIGLSTAMLLQRLEQLADMDVNEKERKVVDKFLNFNCRNE